LHLPLEKTNNHRFANASTARTRTTTASSPYGKFCRTSKPLLILKGMTLLFQLVFVKMKVVWKQTKLASLLTGQYDHLAGSSGSVHWQLSIA